GRSIQRTSVRHWVWERWRITRQTAIRHLAIMRLTGMAMVHAIRHLAPSRLSVTPSGAPTVLSASTHFPVIRLPTGIRHLAITPLAPIRRENIIQALDRQR